MAARARVKETRGRVLMFRLYFRTSDRSPVHLFASRQPEFSFSAVAVALQCRACEGLRRGLHGGMQQAHLSVRCWINVSSWCWKPAAGTAAAGTRQETAARNSGSQATLGNPYDTATGCVCVCVCEVPCGDTCLFAFVFGTRGVARGDEGSGWLSNMVRFSTRHSSKSGMGMGGVPW